mmetsp:Transcript_25906/g.39128  ORF Transcript_25906/g.39128 Transcript_25906/m.39128 type:complete len:87 (+) Transcript_25906:1054-1314(+)
MLFSVHHWWSYSQCYSKDGRWGIIILHRRYVVNFLALHKTSKKFLVFRGRDDILAAVGMTQAFLENTQSNAPFVFPIHRNIFFSIL